MPGTVLTVFYSLDIYELGDLGTPFPHEETDLAVKSWVEVTYH